MTLENSIGKLLIDHDRNYSYQNGPNPFGSSVGYQGFLDVYESHIKFLDTESRATFFLFALWHLDFDGHSMFEFQQLVIKDCGDEFIFMLEEYIRAENELKRNQHRLDFTNKVLRSIRAINGMNK